MPLQHFPTLAQWKELRNVASSFRNGIVWRSDDPVLERIDWLVGAYHNPAFTDAKPDILFHLLMANEFWLAKANHQHKDGSTVRVEVQSVSFFRRANGVEDLAQVRYLTADHPGSGAAEHITHWIATVQYTYSTPSRDPKTRRWNPLGFKIVELGLEPEVLTPASSGGSASTLVGSVQ